MEEIHTFSAVKSFIKTHWIVASFFVFGLFMFVGVRLHAESYTWGVYNDDEYHTIQQGLNFIVNGEVENFRAQEATRWLVRAFYPYALVYMNTHMGGNVYLDGWKYPGHGYVTQNFVDHANIPTVFSLDPNLRDLFHALRVEYVAFVALCILTLLFFFLSKKYYVVAFGSIFLLGFNLDLLHEQKIFYIEPGMLASLALLILAYCYVLYRGKISSKEILTFSFLAAWMVSTKLSTIFFVALPLILISLISWPDYKIIFNKVGTYILGLPLFYILINFPAFLTLNSFNTYLHDLFSNFWQYAAGSDPGITTQPGIHHLGLIIYQLEGLFGFALYVLPVMVVFGLYYASKRERMILWPLLALVVLSIISLSGQHVYLLRNAIPFYLPILLVALLALEIVTRKFFSIYGWKHTVGGLLMLFLFSVSGIFFHAGGTAFITEFWPRPALALHSQLEMLHGRAQPGDRWYAVGFSRDFFKGGVYSNIITFKQNVSLDLNSKEYPQLESRYSAFTKGAVVIVAAQGNNKHLTHYILPKHFVDNLQFGNYYVFFNVR